MPEYLPFDAKIVDQSNADGFQFAFHCLRCDTAYMSHFHALSSLAADAGGNVLKKAGGFLGSRAGKEVEKAGGLLGRQMGQAVEKAGDYAGDRAADVVKDKAKDRAFQAAVEEVAHQFILCPHCHRWMCRSRCFNAAADLCQDCAFQGDTAQRRPSLPNNIPPLEYAAPSLPLMSVGGASTSMPPQSGIAGLPSHPVNSGYPAPSQPFPAGYTPATPLRVRIRPSRHHPRTVTLVVVDANEQIIVALHLGADDAQDLADDLVAAAQTAMQQASESALTRNPVRDPRAY